MKTLKSLLTLALLMSAVTPALAIRPRIMNMNGQRMWIDVADNNAILGRAAVTDRDRRPNAQNNGQVWACQAVVGQNQGNPVYGEIDFRPCALQGMNDAQRRAYRRRVRGRDINQVQQVFVPRNGEIIRQGNQATIQPANGNWYKNAQGKWVERDKQPTAVPVVEAPKVEAKLGFFAKTKNAFKKAGYFAAALATAGRKGNALFESNKANIASTVAFYGAAAGLTYLAYDKWFAKKDEPVVVQQVTEEAPVAKKPAKKTQRRRKFSSVKKNNKPAKNARRRGCRGGRCR